MGDREKKLAALTVAIVVVGLLIDRVYAPLRDRWEAAQDKLVQLQEAKAVNELYADRAEDRRAEQLSIFAALPAADNVALDPELRALVQEQASQARLVLQSIGRQGRQALEEEGLAEVWLPIELRSVPYARLVAFLRALREAPGLLKVSALNLRLDPSGTLSASLRLAALVRLEARAEDVK